MFSVFQNFGFLNFNEFLLVFVIMGHPVGVKISKRYSSYSYDSFSTKLFLKMPYDH